MLELRQQYPLTNLLRAAGLARSSFYYQRKLSHRADKHANLRTKIRTIFNRHRGRYGYRRITATIRREGEIVNYKTVQRIMGDLGIKSLVRIKKYRAYHGEVGRAAPNLLQRQFKAERPNQKWVTDVTEFSVGGEKLYLSPILDCYNGEIVAYDIARRPLIKMVGAMLQRACRKLSSTDTPILHSDQGWQYRMPIYREILQSNAITQSMSRRGNCLDNAAMESFFGTLKAEFYHMHRFSTLDELRIGLRRYIHYYNCVRIKLKLGGMSPVEYRARFMAT